MAHLLPSKCLKFQGAKKMEEKLMRRKFLLGFIALLLITFANIALTAQTSRGTVNGTVTDQNGAIITTATVTLTNSATKVSRTTTTNGEGFYRFDAVDIGTYSLKFSSTNFGDSEKNGVVVSANQVSDIGAQLAAGGQQVSVNVSADSAQLLQTEAPVRGGNIEQRRITELPFAGRNPVSLALTLPGVSSNRYGFGVGTFSVNGSRGRSNNFLINGTENNDISVAGQAFQITNPDAIQEVSVQTSNFDAEFGRAGGAVVNVITKGGNNGYHGTAGYLLDSTRDDAITNTQGLNASTRARGYPPAGTEQYFSGTFGGPIVKNRTFFFGSYQEQRQNSTTQFSRTVPTAAGIATLRSVFPTGTNPRLDLYLGIVNGVVGTASLQNIAIGARPGCPDPCNVQFGTGFFGLANTFRDRQITGRVDHKISDNDQFSGNYGISDQVGPLGGGVTFPGFGTANNNRYQNFQLSETHVFSSNWTNEARIAYNRILISFPNNAANPLAQTLPSYSITSISTIGVATNIPQGRVANNYLIQDTVTHISGNHTFRFGFDYLKQRSRQFAPIVERGLLTYTASSAVTGGVAAFTGFANFLDDFSGTTGGTRIDFGSARYYPFIDRQAYFFQDRWRVTSNLTLTLGVRYENFGNAINTLRTAAFTGLFNVDPATRLGPYALPNKVDPDNNNLAPVLGIAYSPSFSSGLKGWLFGEKKSVIRAGYQIGYDSFFNNIASNAATSSPNVIANSFVNTAAGRGTASNSTLLPRTASPLTPLDSQTLAISNLVNPYYQRWSLGIQRSLPFNLIVDASYVGSKGTKLYINEDLNPLVPAALRLNTPASYPVCTPGARLTAANANAQFPVGSICPLSGRYDNIQGSRLIRTNGGSSIYHSGQLNITRRFADNFTLTGAYTYAKLIDNASEVFAVAATNQPQQAAVPSIFGGQARERAVSLFDRTHRASFTYVYELPFYREQNGLVGRVLGGWQVSGVTTLESGAPLTVVNGLDADGISGNNDRPDFNPNGVRGTRAIPYTATATVNPCGSAVAVGSVGYTTGPSASGSCINPSTAQYIGLLAGIGRTGTLGRNTLRTPGINNFNVNVLKRIRITETTRFEFRTEFYNIFNHLQHGSGSVSPFSPGDSGIAANVTTSALGQFLDPTFADGGGRVIRYQVKFTF